MEPGQFQTLGGTMRRSTRRQAILAGLPGVLALGAVAAASAQSAAPTAPPTGKLVIPDFWMILAVDTPGFVRPPDLLPRHLAHQVDLEKRGIMFAAGPVANDKGEHEYAMIIIRARNLAEAKQIAESDPMHQAGARHYTLHSWSPKEGAMTFTVNISDATGSFK
jgi:uncharacterized protein YciI